MPSSFIRSRCGVTLLNISLILVLIGGLVIAGYAMMGPIIKRGKITDTKTTINSNVDAIMSWAVTNCRIPDAGTGATGFVNVAQNPNDAWGNGFAYLYAPELATATSCAGICGINGTSLTVDAVPNVAFLILSSQYSGSFHYNLPSNVLVTQSLAVSGTVSQVATPDPPDIVKIVTLDELKARIGCFGKTGGRLRIVNNELPAVCNGSSSYSATIFADGGASNYSWTVQNAPTWLKCNDVAACIGTFSGSSLVLTVDSAAPPANNLSFTLSDTLSTVTRLLPIKKSTSAVCSTGGGTGTPGNPITFNPPGTTVEDNWNGGDISDEGTNSTDDPSGKFNMTVVDGGISTISIQNGTTSSCIWYQRPLSLTGKKLRAYFNYTFTEGAGFSFAMVPATPGQTTISSCDETSDLGLGSKILTTAPLKNTTLDTLLGAEFKVNNINTGVGLASNCVAIILPKSETCTFTTGNGTNSWQTGSTVYHVRVELDATIAPYTYKVWLTSNTANLAALQNIDAAYSAAAPTPITRTLTADQIGDLSSFFLGFTAGQHSNARVNMTLNGLKFALY